MIDQDDVAEEHGTVIRRQLRVFTGDVRVELITHCKTALVELTCRAENVTLGGSAPTLEIVAPAMAEAVVVTAVPS